MFTPSLLEIRSRAIGNFLRAYLAKLFDSPVFIHGAKFLITFVNNYDPGYPISRQSISNLRFRPVRFCYLPAITTSLDFVFYVKKFSPVLTEKSSTHCLRHMSATETYYWSAKSNYTGGMGFFESGSRATQSTPWGPKLRVIRRGT